MASDTTQVHQWNSVAAYTNSGHVRYVTIFHPLPLNQGVATDAELELAALLCKQGCNLSPTWTQPSGTEAAAARAPRKGASS